jgi:hypothetical protein
MISCDIGDAGITVRNLEGASMPGEELLTVEEVAKELRINAKTVRQYILHWANSWLSLWERVTRSAETIWRISNGAGVQTKGIK